MPMSVTTTLPAAKNPFDLLNLTPSEEYWGQLFAYCAPYATVGSLLLHGISLLNTMDQTAKLDAIEIELKKISDQITTMQTQLSNQFRDAEFKRVAGVVFGSRLAFLQYLDLRNDPHADDRAIILKDTDDTAGEILQYLGDPATVDEYVVAYASLYATTIPIQINLIQSFDTPESGINNALTATLNPFLKTQARVIASAKAVGAKRVSALVTTTVVDDSGHGPPARRNSFSFRVDGGPEPDGLARGYNLAAVLNARATEVSLKENTTAAPLVAAYAAAQAALPT
jgi:hypothetical protein